MNKILSTSISYFPDLIKGNCLYVDKTEYIYRMLSDPKGQFFLSRPRRFGKSLTVSTLEAVFQGRRDLFRGLYLDSADYDWKEYPIIHINFANAVTITLSDLSRSLSFDLRMIAKKYGVPLDEEGPVHMFRELIATLYEKTGLGVVILVDEYDKPLLDHLSDKDRPEQFRTFMDSFYQIIKGSEHLLRFVFITGITKFSKVSIFSKLNNLDDISLNEDYACMLGYTQEEFQNNFSELIENAKEMVSGGNDNFSLGRDQLLSDIKRWYDGFVFCPGSESVYNPVSVGQFFKNNAKFSNYWFSTGTPTFLVKLLKRNSLMLSDIAGAKISKSSFSMFDIADLAENLIRNDRIYQLLFQTGYLTFSDDPKASMIGKYAMRFPNYEVESSFSELLIDAYVPFSAISVIDKVRDAAEQGNTEEMICHMKTYISDIPTTLHIGRESYFHTIVHCMLKDAGLRIDSESLTNIGRIDGVLWAENHIYVMEFKLDKSSGEAMSQIDAKNYIQKFIPLTYGRGMTIHKLAINFSTDENVHNISDWKEEIVH